MIKLSKVEGADAVALLADLLVPVSNILANPENLKASEKTKIEFVKIMMQNSASDIVEILKIMNRDDPGYKCTAIRIVRDFMDLISDDEISLLFGLQGQRDGVTASGSVSESVKT